MTPRKPRPPTEASLQRRFIALAQHHKFLAFKFKSVSRRGVPDVIVISPKGRVGFVEIKTPMGRLSPGQINTIHLMLKQGAECFIVRNMEDAARTLELLEGERYDQP